MSIKVLADVVSDVLLVVMPVFFLKGMKIPRIQRLLLVLSFASAICISIVSIAHSVSLFMPLSSFRILLIQIKVSNWTSRLAQLTHHNPQAALATLICNLLVIVIFVYRFCNKSDIDPGIHTKSEPIQLTTIILGQSASGVFPCSTPSSFV